VPLPVDPLPLVEPDADGELLELDVDGELIEPDEPDDPEADGELLEPAPDVLEPYWLLPLTEPDEPEEPVPDVLGDADGDWLSEMPATCIACWLQRSKSARLSEPPPAVAATGSMSAPTATDANAILSVIFGPPEVCFVHSGETFKGAAIERSRGAPRRTARGRRASRFRGVHSAIQHARSYSEHPARARGQRRACSARASEGGAVSGGGSDRARQARRPR
jgi:hypothetical protein